MSPRRKTNVPYGVNWTFLAPFSAHAILYEVLVNIHDQERLPRSISSYTVCTSVLLIVLLPFCLIYDPAYINQNRQYFSFVVIWSWLFSLSGFCLNRCFLFYNAWKSHEILNSHNNSTCAVAVYFILTVTWLMNSIFEDVFGSKGSWRILRCVLAQIDALVT